VYKKLDIRLAYIFFYTSALMSLHQDRIIIIICINIMN